MSDDCYSVYCLLSKRPEMCISNHLISNCSNRKAIQGSPLHEILYMTSSVSHQQWSRPAIVVSDHRRLMASELITGANKDQLMT